MNRPFRIISINEAGTKFSLNQERMDRILDLAKKINPNKVIVLSVVGAFRSGKSFLLDLLLRFLRYQEQHPGPVEDMKENQSVPTWAAEAGDLLTEGQERAGALPGFTWRPGAERTTTGIWMYGQPFRRTVTDAKTGQTEQVPLLLLDTQGMFDFQTTKELTAAIFGLSTLLSSYQVFNLKGQIQEDTLQQLHYFTEFSRVALQEFEEAQNRSAAIGAGRSSPTGPPFQSLQFLVRDWQHFSDESDLARCLKEMPDALTTALKQNVDDDGTREAIKAAFQNLSCFLLPHPGLPVTKKQYDGDLRVVQRDFWRLVTQYLNKVSIDSSVIKTVQGRAIGPNALGMYIRTYAQIFRSGRMPKTLTLVQAISMTTNMCAKQDALALFRKQMDESCGGSTYHSREQLIALNEAARSAAFDAFDRSAVFGKQEHISSTRAELQTEMLKAYESYVRSNKHKMQSGLEKYIIPVLAAVVAYVLDFATDWTCDAWSETCVNISRLLALFYYLVSLAICWELYGIYTAQGSAAAGMGVMALFKSSLGKIKDMQDELKECKAGLKKKKE
eukprot:gb/GEZN01002460.1/.p1 GENE.gb/GEZN01002460.1/~~gb/GEZN01002460.1/.p1  ORF type:complete len:591 (-),score=142.89 gb/GEZN01002460.1/:701-2374(-)